MDGKGGLNGKDGRDGIDGLGFEDMRVEFDGERTFVFKLARGERKEEFGPFVIPAQINRGVFKEGHQYSRGDVATWGGSSWHCNAATNEKPGDGSKVWTLMTKKGRDGKDGPRGEKGDPGQVLRTEAAPYAPFSNGRKS
jgi:integrin beta 3